jgi:hypothetical protein
MQNIKLLAKLYKTQEYMQLPMYVHTYCTIMSHWFPQQPSCQGMVCYYGYHAQHRKPAIRFKIYIKHLPHWHKRNSLQTLCIHIHRKHILIFFLMIFEKHLNPYLRNHLPQCVFCMDNLLDCLNFMLAKNYNINKNFKLK